MTPSERVIQAAVEMIDEDCDRACDEYELVLMGAPELSEDLRDALLQRFLADLHAARQRHVARIREVFTRHAPIDETIH